MSNSEQGYYICVSKKKLKNSTLAVIDEKYVSFVQETFADSKILLHFPPNHDMLFSSKEIQKLSTILKVSSLFKEQPDFSVTPELLA